MLLVSREVKQQVKELSQLILGTNIQSDFKNQSHEAPKLQRKYKNQKQAFLTKAFLRYDILPVPKGKESRSFIPANTYLVTVGIH